MAPPPRRVVVVANRLPVQWESASGEWRQSPGGLVSALTPILRNSGGSWVGWSGVPGAKQRAFNHQGIALKPVRLSDDDYQGFYVGFCNGTLWPLYHSAVRPPEFHRHWWHPYQAVNERFADAAASVVGADDVAWVQDYQLQLVPRMLRERSAAHRIGFYLHIPFPPFELFSMLPWRRPILEGLLGADVLAFQSAASRSNFAAAARKHSDARGTNEQLVYDGRTVILQVAPIGIDARRFETLAMADATTRRAAQIRSDLGDPTLVVLGVDRLDYTKGIDHRMRAFHTVLFRRPELLGKLVFVQIAVPSREDVAAYRRIRRDIEGWVGRINGDLAKVGRPPIHYLHRSLPEDELVAYYRAADVMLVTPLRDGMNLVAKEYVATRYDLTGHLLLSEFAGAAEQLKAATLVNPYNLDGLADALEEALEAEPGRARRRMRALRASVASHDVYWWADRCLEALGA